MRTQETNADSQARRKGVAAFRSHHEYITVWTRTCCIYEKGMSSSEITCESHYALQVSRSLYISYTYIKKKIDPHGGMVEMTTQKHTSEPTANHARKNKYKIVHHQKLPTASRLSHTADVRLLYFLGCNINVNLPTASLITQ